MNGAADVLATLVCAGLALWFLCELVVAALVFLAAYVDGRHRRRWVNYRDE